MINRLIEEMIKICSDCNGTGVVHLCNKKGDYINQEECPYCDGKGKVLTDEGAILQHIILYGEHPYE